MQPSLYKRFLLPAGTALVVLLLFRTVYFNSCVIPNKELYHLVALASGTIYFISIAFSSALLYPLTFFGKATAKEKITACILNPLAWTAIEVYNTTVAFSLCESLYLGLNLAFILLTWHFVMMGLAETACRYALFRKGRKIKILTPAPLVPLILFGLLLLLLSRQGGAYYFNLLLKGYSILFH